MLHIVCVQKGNYLGRGAEYVNVLHDMVSRNLEAGTEGEFVCFTDDPNLGYHEAIVLRSLPDGLEGWWNKLWLFSEGLFPKGDKVLYLDLDTLILGPLDDIIKDESEFLMLEDFYRPGGCQSSVMMWKSGFGNFLWSDYVSAGYPSDDPGGDQVWIERRVRPTSWQERFPGDFVSYKVHCQKYPPKGAKVVVFHGKPRPHEVDFGWVPDVWKVGGVGSLEILVRCNTEMDQLKANVEYALSLGLPELTQLPANERSVCIVGGGPSLKTNLPELKARSNSGQEIWALNGAAQYLEDNGIHVDAQWIVDARDVNERFVGGNWTHYLASQCHPSLFTKAEGEIILWHEATCDEFIPKGKAVTLVGGGTTVGMKALCGAYALGFRYIHVYGMDSSFEGDHHHSYAQPENDRDAQIDVNVEGKKFKAASWMIRQVEDFIGLSDELASLGCEINVHCGGLLGHVAQKIAEERNKPLEIEGNIVHYDGLWRPIEDRVSVPAVLGEVWKIGKVVEALPKKRTVIQAGGHVGIFANAMALVFDDVWTFEPDPTNYKCLVRNVMHDNVTIHQAAIGSEEGKIALSVRDRDNTGSIGIDLNGVGNIPVMVIDKLGPKNVDLIYLDIEGMEAPALYGASETIQSNRPLIVCENKGLDEISGTEGMLSRFMAEHGYRKVARFMRDDVFAPLERADEAERVLAH